MRVARSPPCQRSADSLVRMAAARRTGSHCVTRAHETDHCPAMIFEEPPPPAGPLRHRLREAYRADETACVEALIAQAELPAELRDRIAERARQLVRKVRTERVGQGGLDAF